MKGLRTSFVSSIHIPTSISKTQFTKPKFLNFQFNPIPSSTFSRKTPSKSKLFTTISSSTSFVSTPEPELEADCQGEKFDWYANWYPVMPVCDLDKRVPHAKKVMGLDIVVWWDRNESEWRVFNDACPHRLAPLSEGRIDHWGRLQCVYHGWCFNGSGDCKFIPQAPPDGPPVHTSKKACVAAYPSTVQNNIVWFWPNSSPEYKDILSTEKTPYVSELDDPFYTKLTGIREFPFGYETLMENLVDPAHLHMHITNYCQNHQPTTVKLDKEGGAPIDITIQKSDINGFQATRFGGISKFIAPCVYYAAFSLPSKKGEVEDQVNGSESSAGSRKDSSSHQRRELLVFFCIPVGPGKSRLIYTLPRNFGVWSDQIIPRWMFHLKQNRILDSDLYLLHLQERKRMDLGPANWESAYFMPTKSDAQVVALRRWLTKYSGGRINWGGKYCGALSSTPPKEQLMDRYRSHVVNCSSCNLAYKSFNALEVMLQVISIGSIGIVAATKQNSNPILCCFEIVVSFHLQKFSFS